MAANMTLQEFIQARTADDGRLVVLVSEHETGGQGPAQIALEKAHAKLFSLYS